MNTAQEKGNPCSWVAAFAGMTAQDKWSGPPQVFCVAYCIIPSTVLMTFELIS